MTLILPPTLYRLNSTGDGFIQQRLNIVADTGMIINIVDDAINNEVLYNFKIDPTTIPKPSAFQLSWATGDFEYLERDTDIFARAALFQFDGLNSVNAPNTMETVSFMESGSGKVKIFDLTNGNDIAESAFFNNTVEAVIDLGVISNLPNDAAVFEMQMRHDATDPGKVRTSAVRFL